MTGTGFLHIVLHVLCSARTSGGYFRPKKSVLSKIATFGCFGVKISHFRGVVNAGTNGQNENFYEIRWSEKMEPKFDGDGSKNGHVTRRKSENPKNRLS